MSQCLREFIPKRRDSYELWLWSNWQISVMRWQKGGAVFGRKRNALNEQVGSYIVPSCWCRAIHLWKCCSCDDRCREDFDQYTTCLRSQTALRHSRHHTDLSTNNRNSNGISSDGFHVLVTAVGEDRLAIIILSLLRAIANSVRKIANQGRPKCSYIFIYKILIYTTSCSSVTLWYIASQHRK